MKGFMTKMQEDRLPGNAVKLYICLFDVFNKSCWKKEWVRVTNDYIKMNFSTKSTSLLYNNRNMLKELGYIDFRMGYGAHHPYTEYKLINLYEALPDAQFLSEETCTSHLPSTVTTNGTCTADYSSHLPSTVTTDGTTNGTTNGTSNTPEPLHCKGSRLPNKKEEEKEIPLPQGIPNYNETFQAFTICFGREAQVEEKLGLIDLIKKYNKDSVEAALLSIADEHQAYSKELCQKHIQRQLYGLTAPAPRRQAPVPGWKGFRQA